jgi:hypothetical protein
MKEGKDEKEKDKNKYYRRYNPAEFKLGGEFGNLSRSIARFYFLAAIEEEAPQVIISLKDDLLKEYKICNKIDDVFNWADVEENPQHESLKNALLSWGKKYHICASWVFDIALNIMSYWDRYDYYSSSEWKGRWVTEPVSSSALRILNHHENEKKYLKDFWRLSKKYSTDKFITDPWNPHNTEWKDYKNYVLVMLEEYRLNVEKWTDKEWGNTSAAPNIQQKEHFIWAVMYQVLNYSDIEISDEIYKRRTYHKISISDKEEEKAERSLSSSNILRAVHKVLKWIGLKTSKKKAIRENL